MRAAVVDVARIIGILFLSDRTEHLCLDDLGETADCIEGCSQFVAHRRQKFAFGLVRDPCFDQQGAAFFILRADDGVTNVSTAHVEFVQVAGEKTNADRHREEKRIAQVNSGGDWVYPKSNWLVGEHQCDGAG